MTAQQVEGGFSLYSGGIQMPLFTSSLGPTLMNFHCIKASIKVLIKCTVGSLGLTLGMSKHNSLWLAPSLYQL